MPDLTIAIDPGSIGTKGFVTLKSFKPELLLMEPEVAEVSQQSLENYEETSLGNPKPENAAWIEYKGEYRAIGFLARDRFYAELNLNQPKLKLALYKTLALLGTIAQKKGLANGASARVGILFPYGEYRDGKLFKEMLTEAVTSFRFRGEERSFELDSYVCRPEGFGVIARGRAPGNSLKDAVIVVIVIGYRDASVYIMNRGIITKGNTAELGFNKFIPLLLL